MQETVAGSKTICSHWVMVVVSDDMRQISSCKVVVRPPFSLRNRSEDGRAMKRQRKGVLLACRQKFLNPGEGRTDSGIEIESPKRHDSAALGPRMLAAACR